MTIGKVKDLRNLDLNLYFFVASSLRIDGYTIISGFEQPYVNSGIYLVDGGLEPGNNIKLPAIAIEHNRSSNSPFQLGGGRQEVRDFTIEIYARSDGERDDLGETIKDYLYGTMEIFDYNQYFLNGTYTSIGKADFDDVNMFPSRQEQFAATRHRINIDFECSYYVSSGSSLIT